MALINCPECSKSISDQSISCPSCGFPTARAVPSPLQQVEDDNNNSRASSRQRQKNSGCSGATIFLLIIIIAIGYWLISAYVNYTEKAKRYSEDQSELHEESQQVESLLLDSELTKIPMLISGSGEDGRYFLISHFTSYELENIKYVRKGNESDAYGEMQIDCTTYEIRKSSSKDLKALQSENFGDWYTPTPDWTDQDIVNFICKKQSVPKQPQLNTERNALKEPISAPETFVSIPMSEPHEDGRYFLTSHTTENGIEYIEYIRKGVEEDSYSKMQINCSTNKMKSYSADNTNALKTANMGDWYTPTPDWTDKDVFNFICLTKRVVSKNIEHHEVVEKVTLEKFKPEPVISVEARPREVLLSNAPSGSEKEYKVRETPIETKEPYNEKVVNKAADDKKERDIARRKSDDRAICEQAIKVNSAYLGKDDPEYSQWKAIERANCMQDKLYE